MSAKFRIEKDESGKFTERSRKDHKEQMDALAPGTYEVSIIRAKEKYSPTRYKYYFSSVLFQILHDAGRFYRIVNPSTGEEREPQNTTELHECMKAIYNPVILNVGGKSRVIAGTTTDLNDRDFISSFLEQIIAEHSGPPYNIEFVSYEDWKGLHAANGWQMFKDNYK